MDDLEEFVTPSGYKASLKKELTYGEFVEVQKTMMAGMKVNIQNQSIEDFSPIVMYDSNKKALEFMVKKLLYPDGRLSENVAQTVFEMPQRDGEALTKRINEITAQNQIDEKKGSLLQSEPSSPIIPRVKPD